MRENSEIRPDIHHNHIQLAHVVELDPGHPTQTVPLDQALFGKKMNST